MIQGNTISSQVDILKLGASMLDKALRHSNGKVMQCYARVIHTPRTHFYKVKLGFTGVFSFFS